MPFYKQQEYECWIVTILKDNSQCFLDLLTVDNTTDEENKILSQELLTLVTICVSQQQHYLDYLTPCPAKSQKPWTNIIKIIAENLKFNDTQHFYNLAYLDALLSCLVHLTATLGWSDSKSNSNPKEPIPPNDIGTVRTSRRFHCGKGPTAAVSVMGLSITRHVLLILNHLLAEMQSSNVKGWEMYFVEAVDTGNLLRNFLALWASRDVVLRAAALQLFGGLAVSPRAAIEISSEVKIEDGNIWELDSTRQLLNVLEEYDFYSHLDIILSSLFTLKVTDNNGKRYQVNDRHRHLV
ncbi:hypothetical protein NQ317_012332 [Molorchus minor]|uniref:Uncharacterized protein n=1 Tax=Molorchus minor TaxID=1323400 RepID=A0ABQ9IRI9_9CUCU|nr:hypothetical protein NQ317_012332 [Molorchus minor]